MYQYRFVLARMQRGDTDRELARGRYMGRRKLGELRQLAAERGWLAPDAELPDDETIAAALGTPRRASTYIPHFEWRIRSQLRVQFGRIRAWPDVLRR